MDINKVGFDLKQNEKLAFAAFNHPVVKPILEHLSTVKPTTAKDISKVASKHFIKPNVIQLTRLEDGYKLKIANSEMFSPKETEADRATMVDQVGDDIVESADKDGSVIVSTNPVVSETAEDENISEVKEFGEYRVKDTTGKEHMGWVFPIVRDFDGTSLPLIVFTNGTIGALQSKVVGSFVGRGTNIIKSKPEGYGFFYRTTTSGGAVAFIPLEIKHPLVDQFGKAYMCETIDAEPIIVRPVSGFTGIQKIDEGHYAIPGDCKWAPLGDTIIKLIDDATLFVKESSLQKRGTSVKITSNGRYWSFRGPAVEKLAHVDKESLNGSDAYFLSCVLGMEPKFALGQLIKSAKKGSSTVYGCRRIKLAQDILKESREEAEQLISKLPKKQYLLKEAVSLQDINTIDKVLSLGFINPENIDIFISYIPDLEKAVSKLAELLVAIRLGLSEISETACKSAMEKLDEVTIGLKSLMHSRIGVN
jgi:hypothetical protein